MLKFTIWDVQHGNAIFIQTPTGKNFVIDLGKGSYGPHHQFSPLRHLHFKARIETIDGLIITHPHLDHIADIQNLGLMHVNYLHRPKWIDHNVILKGVREQDLDVFNSYLELDNQYSSAISLPNNPFLAKNNGGLEFEIFCPDVESENINNHSLVTIIKYGGTKILIPGDNESQSWENLLDNEDFKNAVRNTDVLIAPHHGRESGYSSELFQYFRPTLTIISDGKYSETSATANYSQHSQGAKVQSHNSGLVRRNCLTTRKDGCIQLSIRNNGYVVKTSG